MKIGDINVPISILDLEHRVLVMEQLVQYIANNNQNLNLPSHSEYENFKEKALEILQKK